MTLTHIYHPSAAMVHDECIRTQHAHGSTSQSEHSFIHVFLFVIAHGILPTYRRGPPVASPSPSVVNGQWMNGRPLRSEIRHHVVDAKHNIRRTPPKEEKNPSRAFTIPVSRVRTYVRTCFELSNSKLILGGALAYARSTKYVYFPRHICCAS